MFATRQSPAARRSNLFTTPRRWLKPRRQRLDALREMIG